MGLMRALKLMLLFFLGAHSLSPSVPLVHTIPCIFVLSNLNSEANNHLLLKFVWPYPSSGVYHMEEDEHVCIMREFV